MRARATNRGTPPHPLPHAAEAAARKEGVPTCRTQTRHTRVRARITKGILTQRKYTLNSAWQQATQRGHTQAASWHKAAIHADCLAEQLSSRTQTLTQLNLYMSRHVVGAGANASQHPSVAFS